jgi:hypothetical protein
MSNIVRRMTGGAALTVMLFFSLGLAASGKAGAAQSMGMKMNGDNVYVCSCMKTKSCPCMTEANMKGKCACGAKSPDMKAVARNSAWARHNRKALAGASHMKMKM